MRKTIPCWALTALLAAWSLGAAPTSAPSEPRGPTWDDYRLIVTRNIFSRNRSSPSPRRTVSRQETPRVPEATLVLIGTAVQDDQPMAFFENSRTGQTTRLLPGQSLGGGTVVSIALDSVEYRAGDATRRITVGETLSGLSASLPSSTASTQPAGEGPAVSGAAAAGTADSGSNDIFERMRRRRLQETNP